MGNDAMTFEQIDAHVEKADLKAFEAGGAQAVSAGASAQVAVSQVCAIWKIARPIIVAISALPILPKKWREALKVLINVLDTICP